MRKCHNASVTKLPLLHLKVIQQIPPIEALVMMNVLQPYRDNQPKTRKAFSSSRDQPAEDRPQTSRLCI